MLRRRLVLLLALFFCSGACGLIYQVVWLRQLSLIFGVTVYAASTVLAAFMSGLAVGSLLAPRVLARVRRPIVAFAGAEICVGLSALLTPIGFSATEAVYAATHRMFPDALGVITVARLVCSAGVLLVPTALMGLTLPLLSSSTLVLGSRLGSRMGGLYAANTAGATFGVLSAGFYLIGGIGMQQTLFAAAAINLLIGLVALRLARRLDEAPTVERFEDAVPRRDRPAVPPVVAVVVLLSGVASLGLEVVWFRVLLQFVDATTYAFTTMLATVLSGIAIGGAIGSRLLARDVDWTWTLCSALVATSIAAIGSPILLHGSYVPGLPAPGLAELSLAFILPAAIGMGIAFPVALHAGAAPAGTREDGAGAIASRVGRLYALNVVGAILGTLAAGFVLLPLLGSRIALTVLSGLFMLAALVIVSLHVRRGRLAIGVALGLALFVAAARRAPLPVAAATAQRYGAGLQEIFREEGVQTTVTVRGDSFRRMMLLDGIHQADDTNEMVTLHSVIGHLPMVLHPSPVSVLVIGLGGGVTPGAMSTHPGTRVQIVELSTSVLRGAAFFSHVNQDVLHRPNVRLRLDDGRNFLKFTRERFDVVTADVIQPILAGSGNLYSREYFTLVRRALRPRGLALQWIGHPDAVHYKMLMRTFVEVFPGATLWCGGTLMVGSAEPLRVDGARVERLRYEPGLRAALDAIGLDSADTLRSWFTAGPAEMRRFAGAGPILTDDRPLLEYYRSIDGANIPVDLTGLRGDAGSVVDKSH